METQLEKVDQAETPADLKKERKATYAVDIVLWVLWGILMWGFLITISIVSSPANRPGIHELIITGYFLGFSVVFAIIYLMVLKRG
ncbi:hypothetical protein [Neobacillus mesonae]|uniref:hypothetical protein n=1 Tax=Neobacillus mesonae TaxID=1193713 RepID=UPI002E1E2FD9|nr:hypothetical protein [Neobacillus mesonae]